MAGIFWNLRIYISFAVDISLLEHPSTPYRKKKPQSSVEGAESDIRRIDIKCLPEMR